LAAGQYAEAEQMYQKAIMDSQTPDQAFLRVAVSVYDNRYVETAYKMMKTYFTIVPPNNRDGYAYMALCCYDLKLHDEFLHYLLEACQRNPHECRMVLSHLFPEEVLPENYYDYMISS
jgi:tetratricopeptide (TPR) repeat protein